MLGIALSCSEYTNIIVFYNPILDNVSTFADYVMDKDRHVSKIIPSLRYNGGGGGGGNTFFQKNLMLLRNLLWVNEYLYKIRKHMTY